MNKLKVYEAGKMSGLNFAQMNNWRVEASKMLKEESDNRIHTINPCDFYNFSMNPNTYIEKEVKEFDLLMVKQSDVILVNMDYPDSIGTAIELHMATVWGIPVIGFGETKNHPWIELCLTKRCKTLEDAVGYILDYYLPNY